MQLNSRKAAAKEAAMALKMFGQGVGAQVGRKPGQISPFNKRIRLITRTSLAKTAAAQGKRVVDLL